MLAGINPADRLITRDLTFPTDVVVEEMAQQVRDYLGVNLEEQCSWLSDNAALENWRQVLNDAGIFIFKDAFKLREYSGFCLYDQTFPIIYANNSTAKTRQTFTLFHELAHLIFHTSGVDTQEDQYIQELESDARLIEIICNQFAAEFLVPDAEFEVAFRGMAATTESAEELAAHFRVSREFIFRKFLDRGLIDEATYGRAARTWADQLGEGGGGGNWYYTKISYLGRDYIRQAFSQYYQNRIDENQLAQYLDTKPKNLSALEEHFVGDVL